MDFTGKVEYLARQNQSHISDIVECCHDVVPSILTIDIRSRLPRDQFISQCSQIRFIPKEEYLCQMSIFFFCDYDIIELEMLLEFFDLSEIIQKQRYFWHQKLIERILLIDILDYLEIS